MKRTCEHAPSPLEFFGHLAWIDGTPLRDHIEPYRAQIFTDALYTFDPAGRLRYDRVLAGRAKKNWKSADLVLAALYRLMVWRDPQGNDGYLLANDEQQAADDLKLAKKLIVANSVLSRELTVKQKEIERNDGRGTLMILPAKDVLGAHGKTYSFIGFDEIHGYRNYDLFEALSPDPSRLNVLTWITSYNTLFNTTGVPLHDMLVAARSGDDPHLLFSWYSGDHCTDPAAAALPTPEERANPSMASWGNARYLDAQRRRLPTHKYRRLHLNLPGLPEGALLDPAAVAACVIPGRRSLHRTGSNATRYHAFVDMSGGSSDDACLGIAHASPIDGKAILDTVLSQAGRPPFNPRAAVERFATTLKSYGLATVTGDAYAGLTFRQDFEDSGIAYTLSPLPKSDLYGELEVLINAGRCELLDLDKLIEQALTLVMRGSKIDHSPGDHDDWINAAAGALWLASEVDAPMSAADFSITLLGGAEQRAALAEHFQQWERDVVLGRMPHSPSYNTSPPVDEAYEDEQSRLARAKHRAQFPELYKYPLY